MASLSFNDIKDDIKDGKYGDVDFDDFSENYIDDVQKSIRAEAEKGNYITEDGRIANPFEAGNNRGGGDPQGSVVGVGETGPDRGPPPSASPRDGGNPGGTSISSGRDASTGAGMNEGQGDNGRDDAGNDGDSGTSSGNQGGGYGGGTDCLTEDMKVKLNGVIDFVTNIKVGDMIDNYKVKEVLHKHMRSGYYAINNELKISNDHPVLANGTWTRSG